MYRFNQKEVVNYSNKKVPFWLHHLENFSQHCHPIYRSSRACRRLTTTKMIEYMALTSLQQITTSK